MLRADGEKVGCVAKHDDFGNSGVLSSCDGGVRGGLDPRRIRNAGLSVLPHDHV